MEEGILGYLKGKTVIVATHALAFLPYFDHIFVMDQGGIILEGTYDKLKQDSAFNAIYEDLLSDNKKVDEDSKKH